MQKFSSSFVVVIVAILFLNSIRMILAGLDLPVLVIDAIAWILLLETVTKFLLLQVVPPFTANKTYLKAHSHLNLDIQKFHNYSNLLQEIGFKKLTDYTCPSIRGMACLFYYPQHNCYAEVGMLEGHSAFCSIVGGFENDWFFAVTNHNPSINLKAISYVFLTLPRTMCKIFDEEPKLLFESFLNWQSEVKSKLAVETIAIADEEMYFTWERNKRKMQRQRLMRRSIVLSLIRMFLFSLNPKTEWMGNYPKYSN